MNVYNRTCEVLDIKDPIIQAGMVGDKITTINLIVIVCEAGDPGTLGAAYMYPEDIRQAAAKLGNKEYMPLWCGQSTRLLERDRTAADLVTATMQQAKNIRL